MTVQRSTETLPTALERAAGLARRLATAPGVIFLDYDGTLSPIAPRPEDAVLDADVREIVRRLADRWPVAIVSGRDLDDVRALVALDEAAYAGSHGFDIAGPSGSALRHQVGTDYLPTLHRIAQTLEHSLAGVPGARLERKRFTVAVHFRLVANDDRARIDAAVDAALKDTPALRKTTGKAVYELRPRLDWDKGRAVRWLVEHTSVPADRVMYIGDDDTDEDAFQALGTEDAGIIVTATPGRTHAQYRLSDPGEVAAFLAEILRLARGEQATLSRWM